MRLWTFWTALSLAGTALCDSYKVYLRDIDANGGVQIPGSRSSTVLNARQAQILLAYRSGVSDNEDLGAVDTATLTLLNDNSGADDLLDSKTSSRRRLYIFNDESAWTGQYANWQPQFEVIEPLESLQNSDLLRQNAIHATSIKELEEHTNTPTHLTILVRSAYSAPLIEQASHLKRSNLEDDTFFSIAASNSTQSSNSTSRKLALLPTCFKEMSYCQQQTNNCSGHGECYLRYTNKDAKTSCYACRCSSGNGTSTWAGAACQKKDISVSFWLLSGFSVTIIAAVVAGIGMLYSVGESELPSVLGAGVPPTRK